MFKFQNVLPQSAPRKIRAVTIAWKGGYTVAVQNIFGILPPPPEEQKEIIDSLNTIMQGIHNQSYKMKGLAQANAVITSSNSEVTAQLAQMTATMNTM